MKTILETVPFSELCEGDLIVLGGYHKNVTQLKVLDSGYVEFLAVDAEKVPNTNTFECRVKDLATTKAFRVTEDKIHPILSVLLFLFAGLGVYVLVLALLVQIFNPSLLWSFLH